MPLLAQLPHRSLFLDSRGHSRVDIDVLQQYVELGLIKHRFDEEHRLHIWNSTWQVTKNGLWDEVTTETRCLITDGLIERGKVVARTFCNFHHHDSKHPHRPAQPSSFTVHEEVDGSMCLLFCWLGNWILTSRGSFDSKQSRLASSMLDMRFIAKLEMSLTYTVELVHPSNRILVDYGRRRELVVLAAFKADGTEVFALPAGLAMPGISLARTFSGLGFRTIAELTKLQWRNAEGFVVRYSDGGRCKVKFEAYRLAHGAPRSYSLVHSFIRDFFSLDT